MSCYSIMSILGKAMEIEFYGRFGTGRYIIKIDCEKLDMSRFQEVINTYLIVCMYNKSSSHRQSVIC